MAKLTKAQIDELFTQHTPVYKSGEDLKNDLEQLPVGTRIIYHGVLHRVVEAGDQGHRVAAIISPESWEITSIEDRKGYDIEIFLTGEGKADALLAIAKATQQQ